MTKSRRDLTFKHNLQLGRHGWLRLTPAYSVKLVQDIIRCHPEVQRIFDPFSGTGTTGVVASQLGLSAHLLDINPFLVWLTTVKTSNYRPASLVVASDFGREVLDLPLTLHNSQNISIPALHNIERWWSAPKSELLALLHKRIELIDDVPARNLINIAFCRLLIELSNASFNHQSMSFKESQNELWDQNTQNRWLIQFNQYLTEIVTAAAIPLIGQVSTSCADARAIPYPTDYLYDCVITSPPYPNRMSYIRELRPYMYWLGYLKAAREAGELDWKAIGGTWGIATSRLKAWQPNGVHITYNTFNDTIGKVAEKSTLLANYIHKYFVDILTHLRSLYVVLIPGAKIYYVVGNSKFYDTIVPVEQLYAYLMNEAGFDKVTIQTIRKRNSKKELFEYIVSARKPN